MNAKRTFHILTVGWDYSLSEKLLKPVAAKSMARFSCIAHPKYTPENWPRCSPRPGLHFFCQKLGQRMPRPDHQLLALLERDSVPTVHNMIMGDRILSKLSYADSLGYGTFIARRLIELFTEIKPSVIIGGFDGLHGSLALAVAEHMKIPWFALHFSVIPPGLACFCDRVSPAARVLLNVGGSRDLRGLAAASLERFESKAIKAHAHIAPSPLSVAGKIAKLPLRALALVNTMRKARLREPLKFTEMRTSYSVYSALCHLYRSSKARRAISKIRIISTPPTDPFVFFGLHMQPESSIDVWAPFFSNQMWVIELLSRSIPPTHKLLVKIHKSDVENYSLARLRRMASFPGVELIRPFVDTRRFIERADLIIAIQGTIGLEGALLGKPVIMLGDSPVTVFPTAIRIGAIADLPKLIRQKLAEAPPTRSQIINAYASYLAPFFPASLNNWRVEISSEEIDNYVILFDALRQHLMDRVTERPGIEMADSGIDR